MTREDNPKYFAHVCEVIKAVFLAEVATDEKQHIGKRLSSYKITPDEYVEAIAEEMISHTDKSEVEDYGN